MLLLYLAFTLCDVAIGIDLGTTFSCLRGYDQDTKKLIEPQINGSDTYASVVSYEKMNIDGKTKYLSLTGSKALDQFNKEPNSNNLFYAVKRLLGLTSKDLDHPKLKDIDNKVTYKIIRNKDGTLVLKNQIGSDVRYIRPIDVSAAVLRDIHTHAKKLGTIKKCIITVPAYFNENQVAATGRAAELAGLKMDKTLNEPVAAAYAYQQKNLSGKDDIYLVFDFGGGTLDISILMFEDGILEVKTYSGSNFCGGENINDALFNYFLKKIKSTGYEVTDETEKLSLRNFVEHFKIELCNKQNEDTNTIANIKKHWYYDNGKVIDFSMSTSEFNKICMKVFDTVRHFIVDKEEGIIQKYKDMGGDIKKITKVLFVGGSTKIPYIRQMLSELFPNSEMNYSLNADTCVAEGAAYYAAQMAGYLESELHLVDVVPMSIGICVGENQFVPILQAEKALPASGTQTFTTQYDNQKMVSIQVAQGIRFLFKDNNKIGNLNLDIKKPGPRGVPQIEVTIHMDKDRCIFLEAKDLGTGESQNVKFEREGYLSDQIKQKELMAKMLEAAEDDKIMEATYEAKLSLERYIEGVREKIKDLSVDLKSDIELHLSDSENYISTEKENASAEDYKNELKKLSEIVDGIMKQQTGKEKEMREEQTTKEDVREEL